MAPKKFSDEVIGDSFSPVVEPAPVEVSAAPSAGDPGLVIVENRTSVELGFTCLNGVDIALGPWTKSRDYHFSPPLQKKIIPAYVLNKLLKKGDVRILSAGGSN
jgi:hypothetical protein